MTVPQQSGVDRPVDQGLVDEHRQPIRAGMVAGVGERDQPAVGVDAVRQHMTAQRILVGGLDLVGEIGEEAHVGEAELAQQLVPRDVGAGQLLVGFCEVGL
jgi:hypothetical protein